MVNRINRAREERDQGFTLIELLVVIIIIGILAAIAIPVFLNQRKKGVDAGIKADLKNAAIAAETYSTDNPSVSNFDGGAATPSAANVKANLVAAGFGKASPGNTIEIAGGPAGGFCIRGFNAGASAAIAAGSALIYDSRAGGLAASCSLTTPSYLTIS